jgi:hypothetical protein
MTKTARSSTRLTRASRFARAGRPLAAALLFSGLCSISSSVQAVPPEYFRNLALHPSDPNVMVLRYESAFGGLFFSRDAGHSFQMLPGQTFTKYDLRRFVPMLIDGEGKLIVGLDTGLHVDDGKGCALDKIDETLGELWIADVAPHPSEPDTTFLITTGDTKGKHSGVWRRKGGTVSPLGMSEPAPAMPNKFPFIASALRVIARPASTEGVRLLVLGTSYDYATTTPVVTPVLRVSDDLGMSWTSHTIPDAAKAGGSPRFLLVDASSDPFKALIQLDNGFGEDSTDPMDTILVTKDGGQNFTLFSDKLQVAGEVAQLPSGEILLGDRGFAPMGGGLWLAANLDSAPTKIADFAVHCLAYQPKNQKLYLCKLNELGYYDVSAKSFCEIFQPPDTTSFVSCPSAPLEQNAAGIKQVCNGFCGAAHYSSAPVCSTFTPPAMTNLCGPAAYMYDNSDPDPNKRWVEPPGPGAAPRCTGFTGPSQDGGVAPVGDAGSAGTDAGGSSGTTDAGAASSSDAGSPQVGPDGEDDAGTTHKKGGGCQLAARDDGRSASTALSGLLALLFGFTLRRMRVQRAHVSRARFNRARTRRS